MGCSRSSSSWSGSSSSASSWPVTCATRSGRPSRSSRPSGAWSVPALIYALVTFRTDGAAQGWAIPTATDIAFALAVLAIISTHLPSGMRTFLLTLAVVDDLIAVTIIAIFYTSDLSLLPLVGDPGASGTLRPAGAEARPLVVVAAAAGRDDLGPHARVRRARHRRRGAARLHRPGDPLAGRGRTRCRPWVGRALRAPDPTHLGRLRRARLRVLRRGRRDRRAARPERLADRPDRTRHRARPGARQAARHLGDDLAGSPLHPGQPRRGAVLARRPRARSCSPGSGSPSPC